MNGMSEIISMNKILEQCRIFADTDEGKLPSVWRRVVSRIKSTSETSESDEASDKRIPLGERLAANTRVVDLKNGMLIIESDHPGWIQYLKFYQKFILKGLSMESPELKIKSLAFKLKTTEENEQDVYEIALKKAREELEAKNAERQKEVEEFFEKNKSKNQTEDENTPKELPPELKAKFDSLWQSMLTNSEK